LNPANTFYVSPLLKLRKPRRFMLSKAHLAATAFWSATRKVDNEDL